MYLLNLLFILRIVSAEERWRSWYGSLESGPFNFDCFDDEQDGSGADDESGGGWSSCKNTPQAKAPLASATNVVGSCGAVGLH